MNKLIYFLISFFLFSCTKEVDLDIPNLPQKVVVNSLFCPDSVLKVHVSLSTQIKDPTINYVENASCFLYENDILIKTFNTQTNGYYNSFYKPKAGKKYKIEVEVPGFEKVWAETSIPILPDSLIGRYYLDGVQSNAETLTTSLEITFIDDQTIINYYEPMQNPFRFQDSKQTDQSILSESDIEFEPLTFYFSDLLFNGTKKVLVVNGAGKQVYSFNGTIFFDEFYLHEFKIVSHEYYNFRKSWTKHLFNQNGDAHYDDPLTLLFLGDPIEMYSNVTNGYGIFAGYNMEAITITYVD